MKGIICSWNEKKGFGFIKPELSNIHQYFFHVSKVHSARQAIKLNAQVTFDIEKTNKMTKQRDPKLAAKNVVIIGASTATATLKLIAIYSGLPMLLLSKWLWFAPLVFAYYCLISLITFFSYALDKSKALQGQWRIPESTLHLLELLGGWPGAMAAQRVFRHKIRKTSYQITFWLIVCVHLIVTIDALWLNNTLLARLSNIL